MSKERFAPRSSELVALRFGFRLAGRARCAAAFALRLVLEREPAAFGGLVFTDAE